MQVTKYNLTLQRLRQEHIEQVRVWRNAVHVRKQMEYQEIITPEMQAKWFTSIDTVEHFYFLIKKENSAFGVANLKDIDWVNKKAEAGVFVGETDFLHSLHPVFAVLVMMDLAFEKFGLKELRCQVSTENAGGILFNERLGYIANEIQPKEWFIQYSLTRERYRQITAKLHRIAARSQKTELDITFSPASTSLHKALLEKVPDL